MKKLLIIDDDEIILIMLSNLLSKAGFEVFTSKDGESGLIAARSRNPDLVITDFKMPGISGLEVVQELAKSHPGLPVIVLTAHGDVSLTIKSMQVGAFDYIEKPIQPKELIEAIRNGIQVSVQSQALTETISFSARKAIEDNLLAGKTPVMREIFKNIGRISLSRMNVLITGEPGTGKKQVAKLIHYSGVTRDFPIFVVNCQSADEAELEQELFGGSMFDTSRKDRKGKLEQADEGTVLIHDFSALSINLQTKLLRVLQNMEFLNTDSGLASPLNARIIATSSSNLEEMVEQGLLLKELYYQLKVFHINLPPLRERIEDIPEILSQLIQKLNRRLNKNIVKIEEGTLETLKKYNWPGNIKELENVLTQAIVLSRGDVLEKDQIHLATQKASVELQEVKGLVSLDEVEKAHITNVLNATNWSKLEASKILNITRPTLNAKISKYNISKV